MGKARGAIAIELAAPVAAARTTTTTTTSTAASSSRPPLPPLKPVRKRKPHPTVASIGVAVLVQGGYTPLPTSAAGAGPLTVPGAAVGRCASSVPPLHEFATPWPTRSEACQAIRESGVMRARAAGEASSLGRTRVDVELLVSMRNWVASLVGLAGGRRCGTVDAVLESPSDAVVAQLRALLQGMSLSSATLGEGAISEQRSDACATTTMSTMTMSTMTKAAAMRGGARHHDMKRGGGCSSADVVDPALVELDSCDWQTLAFVARAQIDAVLDPFLLARGWLPAVKLE